MKDRIKAIRNHFALSQEQFAKKISKTTSFISTAETGRCGLSDSTILTICSIFDVNEEWLRTGTGEMLVQSSPAVDRSAIGGRVREIRKRQGLTQQQFADRIGFHKNQVYNVENGKSRPSDEFLSAVSREFMVGFDWLNTGEADEKDPVDERLIEWLRRNPDIARELRLKAGLE